jgi:hypothetical protein
MKANLLRAVRLALARTRPLSGHPDANLLAAFAEHSLAGRERAEVCEHLTDCAECRELVVLAYGGEAPEPAAMRRSLAIRRRVLWSYAFTTAGVCIVVSSAVWQYRERRLTPMAPPPGPPAISAPQPPRAAPAKAAARARRFAPPPIAAPVAAPKQLEAPAPPPPPPPQGMADALSVVPQQQVPAPQYNQQAEAARPGARYFVQDQAAAPAPALARSASAHMKAASGFAAMVRPAPVVWRSASGVVQRSNDGGATWVAVPISDEVSFRAVAHFGRDVWAGGSEGALFHSADSGAHWERVATDTTGTIVAIRAGAGGEAVVTTDDGRTWRVRDTPH